MTSTIIFIILAVVYVLAVLASLFYSLQISKRMRPLAFGIGCSALVLFIITSYFFGQGYHPAQMIGFVFSFSVISTVFLFNKAEKQEQLYIKMGIHAFTFLLHMQFVILIYFLR